MGFLKRRPVLSFVLLIPLGLSLVACSSKSGNNNALCENTEIADFYDQSDFVYYAKVIGNPRIDTIYDFYPHDGLKITFHLEPIKNYKGKLKQKQNLTVRVKAGEQIEFVGQPYPTQVLVFAVYKNNGQIFLKNASSLFRKGYFQKIALQYLDNCRSQL